MNSKYLIPFWRPILSFRVLYYVFALIMCYNWFHLSYEYLMHLRVIQLFRKKGRRKHFNYSRLPCFIKCQYQLLFERAKTWQKGFKKNYKRLWLSVLSRLMMLYAGAASTMVYHCLLHNSLCSCKYNCNRQVYWQITSNAPLLTISPRGLDRARTWLIWVRNRVKMTRSNICKYLPNLFANYYPVRNPCVQYKWQPHWFTEDAINTIKTITKLCWISFL